MPDTPASESPTCCETIRRPDPSAAAPAAAQYRHTLPTFSPPLSTWRARAKSDAPSAPAACVHSAQSDSLPAKASALIDSFVLVDSPCTPHAKPGAPNALTHHSFDSIRRANAKLSTPKMPAVRFDSIYAKPVRKRIRYSSTLILSRAPCEGQRAKRTRSIPQPKGARRAAFDCAINAALHKAPARKDRTGASMARKLTAMSITAPDRSRRTACCS